MKIIRVLALFILSAPLSFSSFGQKDTMIYVNGEKVVGYLQQGNDDGVSFSIEIKDRVVTINEKKSNIYKILLSNGQSVTYTQIKSARERGKFLKEGSPRRIRQQLLDEEQKIKLLKVNAVALGFQTLSVGVEKMITPGNHWDLNFSFPAIALNDRLFGGVNIQAGYKRFLLLNIAQNSDFLSKTWQGAYVKPELVFGVNSMVRSGRERNDNFDTGTESCFGAMLNLGYQISRPSGFVIDLFAGLGVGNRNSQGPAFEDGITAVNRLDHYGNFSFLDGLYNNGMYTFGINLGYQL